jgi:hypothetical protein
MYCSAACKQVAYRAKQRQLSNANGVYYVKSKGTLSQVETLRR